MNAEARDLWARAEEALRAATALVPVSPDAAASRAYYAAFYAVSALLALEGQTYRKHTAVNAAVHRDLVHPGRWSEELGKTFSHLYALRSTADYGGGRHVTHAEATEAVDEARRIVDAVRGMLRPDALT